MLCQNLEHQNLELSDVPDYDRMTCKLTLALRQRSVPEVSGARDRSKRSVYLVAVLELKSGVARGVSNELIAVDVVDGVAVLQVRQVRTSRPDSCKTRHTH